MASATEEDRQEEEKRQSLTTVYNGETPVVDIVAVHDLNGDAFGSYKSSINGKFWLTDEDMLPRHIPDCRVLTFSYPALTSSPQEAIKQHAKTLVKELANNRQMEDARERPIIFICHSVGGIIVKQALIDSNGQATGYDLRSICISTSGLIFFRTPHNGCNKANLAVVLRQEAETYGKAVYTDLQQLDSLETGSGFLSNITDMFVPMLGHLDWDVFCFWEDWRSDLGHELDIVVAASSAAPVMGNAASSGIDAEHRNMCKFESQNSTGYEVAVGTLMDYSERGLESIPQRWRKERVL